MQPVPEAFEDATLDEIAECYDVSAETCSELWGLVARYGCDHTYREPGEVCSECGLVFPEYPEPDSPDRVTIALAAHWARLSPEARADIIAQAEK